MHPVGWVDDQYRPRTVNRGGPRVAFKLARRATYGQVETVTLIDDAALFGARPQAARAMGSANPHYAFDPNGNMTVRREARMPGMFA